MKSRRYSFLYTFLTLLILVLVGCKGIPREETVFKADFEDGLPANVLNGKIEQYNGSGVLGRYSQDGFNVKIEGMKSHDMIKITFDLYIHDTWDGNASAPDGKDIWIMNIDGASSVYASFANGNCIGCTQSYPDAQPRFLNNIFIFASNKPNSNAIRTDLPGACKLKDVIGGTSMYRIQRTFLHTASTIDIGCFAGLEDLDLANKNCNESWSVDNMRVTIIDTQ